MDFDPAAVEQRLKELVSHVSRELAGAQRDRCHQDDLTRFAARLLGEERLFYVLLATHFGDPLTAWKFYSRLCWKSLIDGDFEDVRHIATAFFQEPHSIGDHRRSFRCLRVDGHPDRQIEFTLEVLESYKAVVQSCGSQSRYFEVDGRPEFVELYERMCEIKHFEHRLPRFDHLESGANARLLLLSDEVLR